MNEAERNLTLKNTLKKIKIDLHNMTANFQDPMKLKLNVKVSYSRFYTKLNVRLTLEHMEG